MTNEEKREMTVLRRQLLVARRGLGSVLYYMELRDQEYIRAGKSETYNYGLKCYKRAGGKVNE